VERAARAAHALPSVRRPRRTHNIRCASVARGCGRRGATPARATLRAIAMFEWGALVDPDGNVIRLGSPLGRRQPS